MTAKITVRLTPGTKRSYNALIKKYKTNQTKTIEALLKIEKEYPHIIEKYLPRVTCEKCDE